MTVPTVATVGANETTTTDVTLIGSVNPNGLATTAWFSYGSTNAVGIPTTPVTIGSGTTPVTLTTVVTGLFPQTWYFEVVAQNASGTATSYVLSFVTALPVAPASEPIVPINAPQPVTPHFAFPFSLPAFPAPTSQSPFGTALYPSLLLWPAKSLYPAAGVTPGGGSTLGMPFYPATTLYPDSFYPSIGTKPAPSPGATAPGKTTVEQDSLDDVTSCVRAIVLCPTGACQQMPTFGTTPATFSQLPLDPSQLVDEIRRWEPRANMSVVSSILSDETLRLNAEVSTTAVQ